MPSQSSAERIPSVHSGRLRAASVSSMRSTNVPSRCWAKTQFWRADRAPPTWNIPVGEGANRTRTVTASTLRVAQDHPVAGFRGCSGTVHWLTGIDPSYPRAAARRLGTRLLGAGGRPAVGEDAMISRRKAMATAAGVAAGATLAGCGGTSNAAAWHEPPPSPSPSTPPVDVTFTPVADATNVLPGSPVVVAVSGGTLQTV